MVLVRNRGREVMGTKAVCPAESGSSGGSGLVAESQPLTKRVLVVVSELGWFEVYGDGDVSFVTHRAGETDSEVKCRTRPGFRDLLRSRHLKGNGWLINARPAVCRLVWWDRLSELVERYGCVMQEHPLEWLYDMAAAAGMEPHDLLHELLRADREKDSAPQKDAAQGKQGAGPHRRAETNTNQAKGKAQ
jgi:hypothetical protein